MPPHMYTAPRRLSREQGEGGVSVAGSSSSRAPSSPPPPVPSTSVALETPALRMQASPERTASVEPAARDESVGGERSEREAAAAEGLVAPESTEEEEVLLSTEEEGEELSAQVSGELVSLFLENDVEELLERTPSPASMGTAGASSRALAGEGSGWMLDSPLRAVDGRLAHVPTGQAGWVERATADKRELVLYTGHAGSLGDFAVVATTEVGKAGKREIVACVRRLSGEEEVRLDFEQAKAKHGKNVWAAPKLYALALQPVLGVLFGGQPVTLAQVPREHESKALQDLLKQEQQSGARQYSFAVVRQKYGQASEDDILANGSSEEFEEFLSHLGERAALRSQRGSKGVSAAQESDYTFFREQAGMEMAWRVAPLLPLEHEGMAGRKRLIGGHCVVVVFQDSACSSPFPAGCFESPFVHVVIVVRPRGRSAYRGCVQYRDTVPAFGPAVPSGQVFANGASLAEFLVGKCVLGEMAAFESSSFAPLVVQAKRRQLESFRKAFSPQAQKKRELSGGPGIDKKRE